MIPLEQLKDAQDVQIKLHVLLGQRDQTQVRSTYLKMYIIQIIITVIIIKRLDKRVRFKSLGIIIFLINIMVLFSGSSIPSNTCSAHS